jgi:hypothetical protein
MRAGISLQRREEGPQKTISNATPMTHLVSDHRAACAFLRRITAPEAPVAASGSGLRRGAIGDALRGSASDHSSR